MVKKKTSTKVVHFNTLGASDFVLRCSHKNPEVKMFVKLN